MPRLKHLDVGIVRFEFGRILVKWSRRDLEGFEAF